MSAGDLGSWLTRKQAAQFRDHGRGRLPRPVDCARRPHRNDQIGTLFHSQISSVLILEDGRHIALANRWLPEISDESRSGAAGLGRKPTNDWSRLASYRSTITGGERDSEIDAFVQTGAPDTSLAHHVRLEIRFDNSQPAGHRLAGRLAAIVPQRWPRRPCFDSTDHSLGAPPHLMSAPNPAPVTTEPISFFPDKVTWVLELT